MQDIRYTSRDLNPEPEVYDLGVQTAGPLRLVTNVYLYGPSFNDACLLKIRYN
jgi:hypothetical protein